MVSLNQTKKFEQKTLENEIKEFEKIEPEIITDDETNYEIDDLTFQL